MSKTYTIAEIGVNHNGSLKKAIELIKKAKDCGADAVKFQMYDIESNYNFDKIDKKIIDWSSKLSLSFKEFEKIANFCKKIKIEFISSVFDEKSFREYLKLRPKIIKIPSSEIENFQLLDLIKKTKLITIFSNGIADLEKIKDLKKKLNKRIFFKHPKLNKPIYCLYCVSKYPTRPKEMNLEYLKFIRDKCKIETGLSDHTIGIEAPIIATYLGAKIIEKHFKINNKHKCPDQHVSLGQIEFKKMINGINNAEQFSKKKKLNTTEVDFIKKGYYASQNIEKNTVLHKKHILIKKPNLSNNLKLNEILGKKIKIALKKKQVIRKKNIHL